jgi:recombination DNA repair RAD52 pathway protein
LAYENRQLNGQHVKIPFDLMEFDQALVFYEEMVYSSRLEFKLPTIHRKYDNTNKELLSKVLVEKSRINNNSTKKIKWIDNTSYKIE